MRYRWRAVAVSAGMVGMVAFSGCTGSSGNSASGTTTSALATTTTATATTTVITSATSLPAGSSTTSGPGSDKAAQNLVVTPALRVQLVQAGAASHDLTAADYTGLTPGATYYAYDPATETYWAGAQLEPSPASMPAQVANQDDGAYLLFERPASGPWKVWNVGLAGIEGTTCPTVVPAGILALWGWPPASCRPASIT